MSGRRSSAVEKALAEYARTRAPVYKLAAKHGIAASSLYRAIKSKKK